MNYHRQNGTFQFAEVILNRNARSIRKIYHDVFSFMKFSQNKPLVKIININYYDLYYTNI